MYLSNGSLVLSLWFQHWYLAVMVKVPYLAGCHGNGRNYSLLRGSCPLFGPDITVCLHSHVLHLQFTVSPECNPRKRQSAAAVAEIARELPNVICDLQKVESISVIKKSV